MALAVLERKAGLSSGAEALCGSPELIKAPCAVSVGGRCEGGEVTRTLAQMRR